MTARRGLGCALVVLWGSSAVSCQGTAPPSAQPAQPVPHRPSPPPSAGRAQPMPESREDAYARLRGELELFRVTGAVKTSDGLLLPEQILIEVKSEICVESREPGARFWSLDYDTCFAFVARDSVGQTGEYAVAVPCLDADQTYETRHAFGDLRLVQKGPVSFLAESDAGWRHQETFRSSRTQRRDLVLTLEPERFWVVHESAEFRMRPGAEADVIRVVDFGAGVDVVRFHKGWAQIVMGGRIGWMEMGFLGTEQQMKDKRAFRGKQPVEKVSGNDR